jgi:hypothetical protein
MVSQPLRARALPDRLSDAEFWSLIQQTSEPNGFFRSDNLVSDEAIFAQVVPRLMELPRARGVYVGVGPEQNFSYIAALQSPMAFIVDIRRGNLHLQLLYKALFELSADRAEFLSRLFVKPRPAGLGPDASAGQLMRAYWEVKTSDRAAFDQHLKEVRQLLVDGHRQPLSPDDLQGIEYVYNRLFWFGPSITWSSTSGTGRMPSGPPTFADLMRQTDANGRELSFLATEARFAFVKDLQSKNLIVPVVGNFAGPKALRAIGAYVRDQGATIDAFYVSEVEPYLVQDGIWPAFCANVATLPADEQSVLIRPSLSSLGVPDWKDTRVVPIREVTSCRGIGKNDY